MRKISASELLKLFGKRMNIDLLYYGKNSVWIGIQQVVTIIVSLGSSIVFTRLATQETYGLYQYFLAILAIISIVSIPGLNSSIIQSTARGNDADYKKSVRMSFLWSLVGIPILLVTGFYYYYNHNIHLGIGLMIASIFFPLIYAPNTWDSFLRGKSRFDLSAIYNLIQMTVNTLAVTLAVWLSPNNLILIILIYLVSYSFFNIYWYKRSQRLIANNHGDEEALPYGWFLTKIDTLNIIASQFDKILIGVFLSPADLAIYGVGTTLARKFYDFIKSFFALVTIKSAQKNILNKKKFAYIFVVSIIVAAILFLSFPFVIPFLYSSKYTESIILSQIVILFIPFFIINTLYKTHFIFYLRDKSILLRESILLSVMRIIIMIPLLVFYKTKGLAAAFGLQYVLDIVLLYTLNKLSLKKKATRLP